MPVAGIDIGSRTTKLVVLEGNTILKINIIDTDARSIEKSRHVIDYYQAGTITATGYGRHLASASFADNVITEIKAHAIGARYLFPGCRTVLDIGGQDSKTIAVNDDGSFGDFVMNDRCAAGTGKFLEIMAKTLGCDINDFGNQALNAENPVNISSMCTVFAESEIISLIARGEDRRNIALGLHQAITRRIVAMAKKIGFNGTVIFSGGVARNKCIVHLLEKEAGHSLQIPENPQIVGALGAALNAQSRITTNI